MEDLVKFSESVTRLTDSLTAFIKPGEITDQNHAEGLELAVKETKRLIKNVNELATILNRPAQARIRAVGERKKQVLGQLPLLEKKATTMLEKWLDGKVEDYHNTIEKIEGEYNAKYAQELQKGKNISDHIFEDLEVLKDVALAGVEKPEGVRMVKEVEILNVHLLPVTYLMPNLEKIKQDLLEGVKIPGAVLKSVAKRSGR